MLGGDQQGHHVLRSATARWLPPYFVLPPDRCPWQDIGG
jgi:hypothetical protein